MYTTHHREADKVVVLLMDEKGLDCDKVFVDTKYEILRDITEYIK